MPEACVTRCGACGHFQVATQIMPVMQNYFTCGACRQYQPCAVHVPRSGEVLRSYDPCAMAAAAKRLNSGAEASRRANSLTYQRARVHEILARTVADQVSLRTPAVLLYNSTTTHRQVPACPSSSLSASGFPS